MKRSFKVGALLSVLLVVSSSDPSLADSSGPPPILYPKADTSAPPIWVSAAAATTATGEIDWSRLGERARTTYESVLQSTPPLRVNASGEPEGYDQDFSGVRPGCVQYGIAYREYFDPPLSDTLKAVMNNAKAVLRGRIVALTPGFYEGEPSTLLTVQIERAIRITRGFPKRDHLHVVFPFARFSIGGVNFCKNDSTYPKLPAVGDQILLSPSQYPEDRDGLLLYPGNRELILESKAAGRLELPRKFVASASALGLKSLDDVEAKVLKLN